jgi:flagellar hook assembly protein FlgD
LTVFDTSGRRVIDLIDRHLPSGAYSIRWDGTDAVGNPVASGVYYYRMEAGEYRQTRKVLIVR